MTTWKRFAVANMLAAAQDLVRGEEWGASHRVPVNGPRYFQEGYLAGLLGDAGWAGEDSRVQTFTVNRLVSDEAGADWTGLYDFMVTSSIKSAATRGWGEGDLQKWPAAVRASMQQEKKSFGGLLFEAWVVIARK